MIHPESLKRALTKIPSWNTDDNLARGLTHYPDALTMVGLYRLDNVQECIEQIIHDQIPGDLIETGVWRGGVCIFMAAMLDYLSANDRRVFVADSFDGLPKPTLPQDAGDTHYLQDWLKISLTEVQCNFVAFDLLNPNVIFVPGWFKDTLPNLNSDCFSLIRLDGDMYESTMDALTHLYPKLSPGGFCIIDDYGLGGCRAAVHDYREQNKISETILPIDGVGVFWRRSTHV